MRVLVIGHTYVPRFAQTKYEALTRQIYKIYSEVTHG